MESSTHFEKRAYAAKQLDCAASRVGDAREKLEKRRLAGSIAADYPDDLARCYVERDSVERPNEVFLFPMLRLKPTLGYAC
jgi:hypothetical protein